MNFILWTLVWFGLLMIDNLLEYGFPYYEKRRSVISVQDRGKEALLILILWIGLYLLFIK